MFMGIWKLMTDNQKLRWIEANKDKFIKKAVK